MAGLPDTDPTVLVEIALGPYSDSQKAAAVASLETIKAKGCADPSRACYSGSPCASCIAGEALSYVETQMALAEIDLCPDCRGEGWTQGTGHEDLCYETGDCQCSGVPVQDTCVTCGGTGHVLPDEAQAIEPSQPDGSAIEW